MEDMQPKKMIILDILDILKKHTDENHKLSQHQIQELMESEYGMKVDRKTVRKNLFKLIEFGFPIRYRGSEYENDTIIRKGKNGQDEMILTDWYYVHEFINGEIRLLIDSVLFADGLSKKDRVDIIRRLEQLSSKHFHSEMSKLDLDIYGQIENREILITLEDIGRAIAQSKQLSFHYCNCDINGKLIKKLDKDGKAKLYTVNPYQLITKNGHSYLICNIPQYEDLTHFRVDRIKDSQVLNTASEHLRNLKGFGSGIKLSDYVKEHPNLWSGNAVHTTFQCKRYMMNDIVDSFGTNLKIEELQDDMIKIHVNVSESAMLHWALQFADEVEIMSPKSLREQVAQILRNALDKYEK